MRCAIVKSELGLEIESVGFTVTVRMGQFSPHLLLAECTRSRRCCRSTDGRTAAYYAGQPCIPAVVTFQNGDVCRTAKDVALFEPLSAVRNVAASHSASLGSAQDPSSQACCSVTASLHARQASCAEFGVGHLDFAGLSYERQKLSFGQLAPEPVTQIVKMRVLACQPGASPRVG